MKYTKEQLTLKRQDTRHWKCFSLLVKQLTFRFSEVLKLSNLEKKRKSAQWVKRFWDEGVRIWFFEISVIIFNEIFSILTLSRKTSNTSGTEQLFMSDYELLSLPGSWFLFFPLPLSKIKPDSWHLPYIVITPDEKEMLENWQEIIFRSSIFQHIVQQMKYFINISANIVKEIKGLKKQKLKQRQTKKNPLHNTPTPPQTQFPRHCSYCSSTTFQHSKLLSLLINILFPLRLSAETPSPIYQLRHVSLLLRKIILHTYCQRIL